MIMISMNWGISNLIYVNNFPQRSRYVTISFPTSTSLKNSIKSKTDLSKEHLCFEGGMKLCLCISHFISPFICILHLHLSLILPLCQSALSIKWFQVSGLSRPGVQHQQCFLSLYCPWLKGHMNIGGGKAMKVCTRAEVTVNRCKACIKSIRKREERITFSKQGFWWTARMFSFFFF